MGVQLRHSREIQTTNSFKMRTTLVFLCIIVGALSLKLNNKAASRAISCNCQCSNTTFRDKSGRIHGNCKSTDKGGQWCYVDPRYSQCNDLQRSERLNHQFWSYQACATPEIGSYQCRSGNGGYGNQGFNSGSGGFGFGSGSSSSGSSLCRGRSCSNSGSGFNFGSNSAHGSGSISGFNSGSNFVQGSGSNSGFNSGSNFGQGSGFNSGFNTGSSSYGSGQGTIGSHGSGLTLTEILGSRIKF